MSINFQVYSNSNGTSRTITAEFYNNLLDISYGPTTVEPVYYLQMATSATDTLGNFYTARNITGLNDLALAGNVQSATNTTADYVSLKALIDDYLYDYIHGHTANQYLSGCSAQAPMKFT